MKTQINHPEGHVGIEELISKSLPQQDVAYSLTDLVMKMEARVGKKSFLVFKHNKYVTIPTESIAYFYVKYETSIIVCYDRQEYPVNYSLEQIQQLVAEKQFTRPNRQYLINFGAIKDVEHYFARKLLVNLTISTPEQVIVSKEKAKRFLDWMEDR